MWYYYLIEFLRFSSKCQLGIIKDHKISQQWLVVSKLHIQAIRRSHAPPPPPANHVVTTITAIPHTHPRHIPTHTFTLAHTSILLNTHATQNTQEDSSIIKRKNTIVCPPPITFVCDYHVHTQLSLNYPLSICIPIYI